MFWCFVLVTICLEFTSEQVFEKGSEFASEQVLEKGCKLSSGSTLASQPQTPSLTLNWYRYIDIG